MSLVSLLNVFLLEERVGDWYVFLELFFLGFWFFFCLSLVFVFRWPYYFDIPLSRTVNGSWSDWSSWGQCSVSCGVGLQSRTRSCTNPTPKHYGYHCIGQNLEDRLCYSEKCDGTFWWVFKFLLPKKMNDMIDSFLLVFPLPFFTIISF